MNEEEFGAIFENDYLELNNDQYIEKMLDKAGITTEKDRKELKVKFFKAIGENNERD